MKYASSAYFEGLGDVVVQYTFDNWDYVYLKAMHRKIAEHGVRNLFVGSSHAMNGIIERDLDGGTEDNVNLSISSQDIFYDYQHIKKAIEEAKQAGRPIKNCIINFGYYMMYQDLSRSTTMNYLIHRVYHPLFGDSGCHHWEKKEPYDRLAAMDYDRERFPEDVIRPLCEYWSERFALEQSSYYGPVITREKINIMGLKKIIWNEYPEEAKREYARYRTDDHNSLGKYTESHEENIKWIHEMVKTLADHKIKPIFLITPFADLYKEYINPEYKKDIYRVLNDLPYPVEFFDMNDLPEDVFTDRDFMDTDHLNLDGAHKASAIVNALLKDIG